ncbi:hypothetical protein KKG58_05755 [Patescibacteria group bacterium]|nr:hypothetical protein [Patescibacteria group bacterium]
MHLHQGEYFYSYPLHTDEWQHYTISMSLDKDFFHPSVFYYQDYQSFYDGSPVFHWLIYLFQKLGLQPKDFFILPVLQAIFFSIVFFFFIATLLNTWTAFIATIFALFVRSSVGILGILFFKPFVLGFAFFILALFIFNKKKHFCFSFVIASLAAIFCYPPLILPLIIYTLVYSLITKGVDKKYLFGVGILTFLILMFGFYVTKGNNPLLMDKIIYKDSIIGYGGINLIKYLGVPLIIFGLLGVVRTLKNKKLWPFHALFGFFILNFMLTMVTKSSLGFHYIRIIYLGSILFSIYAACGVWYVFKWLNKKIKRGAVLIVLLLITATILPTFIFYIHSDSFANPAVHANWLTQDNFDALKYLNGLPDKNKKLLHPPRIGTVITPLTGFKVTALQTALTGGKTNKYYEIEVISDCGELKKIIKKQEYKLLFLENKKFDCLFLKSAFENKSVVIYEYQDF